MVKLYKRIQEKIFYKECWQHGDIAIVHRGVVGNEGITEEHPCDNFEKFESDFIKQYKHQGYATIPNNEQYLVTIQLKVRSAQAGIELKNQVTEALNEKLGWLGLGCVDGFDIDIKKSILGYYNLEIYCVVVDSDKACNEIKKLMPCAVISDYTISVHVNTGSWNEFSYNKAAYEGDEDLKYKCNLDNRRLPLGRICTNVR